MSSPSIDAKTELQESYSVKAEVAGLADPLTLSGKVVDATGAGGVGQTFTLTTGIDTVGGASANLKVPPTPTAPMVMTPSWQRWMP